MYIKTFFTKNTFIYSIIKSWLGHLIIREVITKLWLCDVIKFHVKRQRVSLFSFFPPLSLFLSFSPSFLPSSLLSFPLFFHSSFFEKCLLLQSKAYTTNASTKPLCALTFFLSSFCPGIFLTSILTQLCGLGFVSHSSTTIFGWFLNLKWKKYVLLFLLTLKQMLKLLCLWKSKIHFLPWTHGAVRWFYLYLKSSMFDKFKT